LREEDFNIFAKSVSRSRDAWVIAAKSIARDLLASFSRGGVLPPWESVDRDLIAGILKDKFGFQRAYFFLELLDMEEQHIKEAKEMITEKSITKGEKLYIASERRASEASESVRTPAGAPPHIFFLSIFCRRIKHHKFVTKTAPHGAVLCTRGRGECNCRRVHGRMFKSALLSSY